MHGMTMIHAPARRNGRTAALYLIGLAGTDRAARQAATEVLQACGYQAISFAEAVRAEAAVYWCIDARLLQPGEAWGVQTAALACIRCSDPAFIRWAAGQQLSLEMPHSPRWVLHHWAMFRRAQEPLYWVRMVEFGLLLARRAGRRHLVVPDLCRSAEHLMLQQHGGRLLQLGRLLAPPCALVRPDAAIECEREHLGQAVLSVVYDLLGAAALRTGSLQ